MLKTSVVALILFFALDIEGMPLLPKAAVHTGVLESNVVSRQLVYNQFGYKGKNLMYSRQLSHDLGQPPSGQTWEKGRSQR